MPLTVSGYSRTSQRWTSQRRTRRNHRRTRRLPGVLPALRPAAGALRRVLEDRLELLPRIRDENPVTWNGTTRPPLTDAGIWPRPAQAVLPIWAAVGGTPASAVRAGRLGLPLYLAILGRPEGFGPLAELCRRSAAQARQMPGRIGVTSHFYVEETAQGGNGHWPVGDESAHEAHPGFLHHSSEAVFTAMVEATTRCTPNSVNPLAIRARDPSVACPLSPDRVAQPVPKFRLILRIVGAWPEVEPAKEFPGRLLERGPEPVAGKAPVVVEESREEVVFYVAPAAERASGVPLLRIPIGLTERGALLGSHSLPGRMELGRLSLVLHRVLNGQFRHPAGDSGEALPLLEFGLCQAELQQRVLAPVHSCFRSRWGAAPCGRCGSLYRPERGGIQ